MASHRNGHPNGHGGGLPHDDRVLKFLAQIVKGQARIAKAVDHLRRDHGHRIGILTKAVLDLRKDVAGLKTDVAGLKTDVAGLKTDVGDLKTRMTRVEHRLDGNGSSRARPGPNGR